MRRRLHAKLAPVPFESAYRWTYSYLSMPHGWRGLSPSNFERFLESVKCVNLVNEMICCFSKVLHSRQNAFVLEIVVKEACFATNNGWRSKHCFSDRASSSRFIKIKPNLMNEGCNEGTIWRGNEISSYGYLAVLWWAAPNIENWYFYRAGNLVCKPRS